MEHSRRRVVATALVGFVCAVTPRVARAQGGASVAQSARGEATVVRIDADDVIADVGAGRGVEQGTVFVVYRPVIVRHPVTRAPLRDRFPIGTVRVSSPGQVLSMLRPHGALARPVAVGDILVPVDAPPPPRARTPSTRATSARAEAAPSANGAGSEGDPRPRAGATRPVSSEAPTAAATEGARAPGDVASWEQLTAGTSPASASPPAQVTDAAGVSVEERAAASAWLATLGRPIAYRVALYQRVLRDHPHGRVAAGLREEIASLQAIELSSREPTRAVPTSAPTDVAGALEPPTHGEPASVLRTGEPAVVAVQLSRAREYTGALLHVRARGAPAYQSVAITPEGDGFLRARIDPALVRPPGFEYFLELIDARGRAVPVVGSAGEPRRVLVESPPSSAVATAGRTRLDVRGEYADVGSIPGRPERFFLLEGDFLQRVGWGPLYGYRVGFGAYDGLGQPLCAYDATCRQPSDPAPPTQRSTVVYGYHELEFRVVELFHVMVRGQVGIHLGGLVAGAALRMRVGRERGTNIAFGGDVTGGVGQRAFFAFNFFPHARVPCLAQGEVFNQAIDGGDPMFRFIAQAGFRIVPWMTLSARGSYQLRRLDRGGFGAGGALTFDW